MVKVTVEEHRRLVGGEQIAYDRFGGCQQPFIKRTSPTAKAGPMLPKSLEPRRHRRKVMVNRGRPPERLHQFGGNLRGSFVIGQLGQHGAGA